MMWFDVLPIHPAPYPLESFTGYLVRLADGNGIRTISGLSTIVFPRLRRKPTWTDLPRQEYGLLPAITTHPETLFHATTFYHLARKLRRSLYAGPLKVLLASSISQGIRFCPHCIAEQGYYSLLWRFTALMGCSKHHCYLLDACGQCGASMPLVSAPVRFGICPACSTYLGDCLTHELPDEAYTQVHQLENDLSFMLTPQDWETDQNYLQSFGTTLVAMRRERGWSQVEMAKHLGITEDALTGLEARFGHGRGETLDDYLRYLGLLGSSFRDVFAYMKQLAHVDEGRLWLERVQQTIEHFQSTQQPLTQQAICHYWGCQSKTLRRYPEVRELLEQLPQQRLAQRTQRLRERVERVIHELQTSGQPVTPETVAAHLARSPKSLEHYPEIWEHILSLAPAKASPYRPVLPPLSTERQAELKQKVEAAIEYALQHHEKLTNTRIFQLAHIGAPTFYRYPLLKELVNQARAQNPTPKTLPNEAKLLELVTLATRQLADTGKTFSCRAVAEMVGMSCMGLRNYPSIQAFFKAQLKQQKLEQRKQLLTQVQVAAEYLQQQGRPVTQRGVAEVLGVSHQRLRHHQHILDHLNSFADYNQRLQLQEQLRREAQLRDEVIAVVEDMLTNNIPLTQLGVSQALNTTSQRLKFYPYLTTEPS